MKANINKLIYGCNQESSQSIESSDYEYKNLSLEFADTEDKRKIAFNLRYQVFVEEYGDYRYAHKDIQEYRDSQDALSSGSTIVLVNDELENRYVGTGRLCKWEPEPFINPHTYPLDLLGHLWGIEKEQISKSVYLWDRNVFIQGYRSGGYSLLILNKFLEICSNIDNLLILGYTRFDNIPAQKMLQKNGFTPFLSEWRQGFGLTLFVLNRVIERQDKGSLNSPKSSLPMAFSEEISNFINQYKGPHVQINLFYANWCKVCKKFREQLNHVIQNLSNVKLDLHAIEEDEPLFTSLGIEEVPFIVLSRKNQIFYSSPGFLPMDTLFQVVSTILLEY